MKKKISRIALFIIAFMLEEHDAIRHKAFNHNRFSHTYDVANDIKDYIIMA